MNRLDTGGSRTCRHCGVHVTRRFCRVFGDDNDIAHRCPACDTRGRIIAGSAAGKDVDKVDPQTDSNRNRGSRVDAPTLTDGGPR
ncbi:DUF7563 family protein [Halobaculum sp. P14]|uniref:DUF7563 family protein n=1 Tax=Halobaculum sp. P14 TaxID=3421638 RepID=UPI003EC089E1